MSADRRRDPDMPARCRRAGAAPATLLQLYTIGDGELILAAGIAASWAPPAQGADIASPRGFSRSFAGFLPPAPAGMTTPRHLARCLRASIKQSERVAHVLGSSARMVALARPVDLHIA
jgi:hypothetical protein